MSLFSIAASKSLGDARIACVFFLALEKTSCVNCTSDFKTVPYSPWFQCGFHISGMWTNRSDDLIYISGSRHFISHSLLSTLSINDGFIETTILTSYWIPHLWKIQTTLPSPCCFCHTVNGCCITDPRFSRAYAVQEIRVYCQGLMRIGRPKPSPGMLFYNLSGSGTTWKSIAHFAPNVLPIAATESFNEIKQPPHHISVGSYNPVYYFRLFYPANCIFFKYTYDNPYTYYGKNVSLN